MFASYDKNIITESLYYINNVYYCLNKFHFKQALYHLSMNKDYEKYLLNYILNNNIKAFQQLVTFIKENNPKREETINKKYEYINNNWKDIQRLYKYKMSCPMESQISHNIAALNITIEHLNMDIFNKYKQFIPSYEGKLFTPNSIRYI